MLHRQEGQAAKGRSAGPGRSMCVTALRGRDKAQAAAEASSAHGLGWGWRCCSCEGHTRAHGLTSARQAPSDEASRGKAAAGSRKPGTLKQGALPRRRQQELVAASLHGRTPNQQQQQQRTRQLCSALQCFCRSAPRPPPPGPRPGTSPHLAAGRSIGCCHARGKQLLHLWDVPVRAVGRQAGRDEQGQWAGAR